MSKIMAKRALDKPLPKAYRHLMTDDEKARFGIPTVDREQLKGANLDALMAKTWGFRVLLDIGEALAKRALDDYKTSPDRMQAANLIMTKVLPAIKKVEDEPDAARTINIIELSQAKKVLDSSRIDKR